MACDVQSVVFPLVEGDLVGLVFDDVCPLVDDVAALVDVACRVVLRVGCVVEIEFGVDD